MQQQARQAGKQHVQLKDGEGRGGRKGRWCPIWRGDSSSPGRGDRGAQEAGAPGKTGWK